MKTTSILDHILRNGAPAIALVLASSAGRADTLKVPAQFPTIQEAVDAASFDDIVQVRAGTYTESVVINQAGITLRGKGATIDARYLGVGVEILADDVTLEGLTLTNGLIGVYAAADRTEVTQCTVLAAAEAALKLIGDDVVVSRCTLLGSMGDSIDYQSDTDVSSSRFEKNSILYSTSDPLDAEGGQLIITQNRIAYARSAVYLTPTHPAETSVFSHNDLELIDDYGLYADITGVAGMLIDKNTIRGTESEGVYIDVESVSGLVLSRNTVQDTASQGIEINAATTSGIVIEKNDVRSATGSGICVAGAVSGVMILDNRVSQTTDESIEAVVASAVISGNKLRASGFEGIRLVAVASEVTDNDVRYASRSGISVEGDLNLVAGNKVVKGLGDGIMILAGSGNVVTDNDVLSNLHEGIDNTGLLTTIDDNVAKKNGGGVGPDIAGAGNQGTGTVLSFVGNTFGTGGADTVQVYDTN